MTPADPADVNTGALTYATLKKALDAIRDEPRRVHGTASDPHLVSATAVRDGQLYARCSVCLRIVRVAP